MAEAGVNVVINGVGYNIVLTDEQLKQMKEQRYSNGFARVDVGDTYWVVNPQTLTGYDAVVECGTEKNEEHYDAGNYYSTKEAAQKSFAQYAVNSKMRRNSLTQIDVKEELPYYAVSWDTQSKCLRPVACSEKIIGCVTFDSVKATENAIHYFGDAIIDAYCFKESKE